MGFTRKILASKKVSATPTFYSKILRFDVSESFHLHYRNLRIEFSFREWLVFGKSMFKAWIKWKVLGSPRLRPEGKTLHLAIKKNLPDKIGDVDKASRGSELSVELQEATDYIHIHYRGTRLELSIDEFMEYSSTISDAAKELRRSFDLEHIVRRVGTNHKTQPEGRITRGSNKYRFDIGKNYVPRSLDNSHKSKVYDANTKIWKNQFDFDLDNKKNLPNKLHIFGVLLLLIFHFFKQSLFKDQSRINREYLTYLKDLYKK